MAMDCDNISLLMSTASRFMSFRTYVRNLNLSDESHRWEQASNRKVEIPRYAPKKLPSFGNKIPETPGGFLSNVTATASPSIAPKKLPSFGNKIPETPGGGFLSNVTATASPSLARNDICGDMYLTTPAEFPNPVRLRLGDSEIPSIRCGGDSRNNRDRSEIAAENRAAEVRTQEDHIEKRRFYTDRTIGCHRDNRNLGGDLVPCLHYREGESEGCVVPEQHWAAFRSHDDVSSGQWRRICQGD